MVTLYSCLTTLRTIEAAIAANKMILWRIDNLRSLYFNPSISSGSTCQATVTPTDNGVGMGVNFVILGGVDGFAAAARSAGLHPGNGLSSETEDWSAANLFLSDATQSSPSSRCRPSALRRIGEASRACYTANLAV